MAPLEVQRGDFVYRDAFFAEVGQDKRHPRASATEIKELLLPKKGNALPKDNVGHWYEAQLLHYGLPRSKDKNTAKMRLLQAVTSGSLAVPAHLTQMEAAMKKDYAAAGRKAKAEAKKAEQIATDQDTALKGKKRKQEDSKTISAKATDTKITLTVGDVILNIDHQGGSASGPATKKQKKSSTTKTASEAVPKTKSKAKANKAEKATTEPSSSTPKAAQATKQKQTARKSTGSAVKPPVKPTATPKKSLASKPPDSADAHPPPAARQKQTARRSKPLASSPSLEDDEMMDAPPPYEAHDFEGSRSNKTSSWTKPKSLQISGFYSITSEELYPYRGNSMTLRIDHRQNKLWGQFDFNIKTGVIMADDMDAIARNKDTTFGWRSRDAMGGPMEFGRGCNGRIEFLGDVHGDEDYEIRGVFHGLWEGRDVQFHGWSNDPEAPEPVVFQQEWDNIPEIAYGRMEDPEASHAPVLMTGRH